VVKIKNVKRGEIWLVDLNPTVGSEIFKMRPCVIISPDELNNLNTVIVAPMTSKGFNAPFRQLIEHSGITGLIVLDQIRSIDKTRLIKKLGTISKQVLTNTLSVLQTMFSL